MFPEVVHEAMIKISDLRLLPSRQEANKQEQPSPAQNTTARVKGLRVQEGSAAEDTSAETDLIQSALAGDLLAFNHLVTEYQDSLYWWVESLVNDEALAEDITQSTFITAFEKLKNFRGGSFRAWLFTIARNRSYDELRRQKRHPSLSLDEPAEDDRDRLEVLPDRTPLPEDALLDAERAAMIELMISGLPGKFRQVVRLVDMEGMDYQGAAGVLGLPLGTVKSRLTRARLKLRQFLQETSWL